MTQGVLELQTNTVATVISPIKSLEMKKQFRLPRKIKKYFKRKWLLYPTDEKGNSLMAQPTRRQADYDAFKQGVLRDMIDRKAAKERNEAMFEKLNTEIYVSDELLNEYVNEIFREEIRVFAFRIFCRAKNSQTAQKSYFNFINAFQLMKDGNDSYGNICCLALDSAEEKLRKENTIGKNRK